MFPRIDLFSIGDTDLFLPAYGLLFATGVIIAWLWFMRRAQDMNLVQEKAFNLTFYSILAGLLSAKVALVVISWRDYLADPGLLLGVIRSAGVLMGGVLGGSIMFYVYARRNGLPLWALADAVAAPLALAQSVGRIGCFFAGCCYGVAASPDNPFKIVFSPLSEAGGQVARVPVQLIQMASDLTLALILTVLWRRRIKPEGTVFWLYVLLYGVSRWTIELWRGDTYRGVYFGGAVSTSQIFSIAAILLALVMLIRGRMRRTEAAT